MRELSGKVAVVTGAASGIGRALARCLASHGMRVVLADLDGEGLEAETARLASRGHACLAVRTDVALEESVATLAERAQEHFGNVHLLCNNAGVTRHTGDPVWDVPVEDWARLLEVNVWGVIHGLRAFLPAMLEHGQPAHIVNTASMAGLLAGCGAYGMTKHAIVSLSESLLFDLRQRGSEIGVSCLCPGLVKTSIARAWPDREESEPQRAFRERIERATFEYGMAPEMVAEAVVEGVMEKRFYLLPGRTGPEEDALVARHQALLQGSAPSPPPRPSRRGHA